MSAQADQCERCAAGASDQATPAAGAGVTAASGASEASGVSSGARRSEPVRSVNSSVNSQWPDGSGLSNATATAVLSGLPSTAPLPAAPRTTPQRAVSPAEVRERAGQSRPARNTQAAGATADG
ncbi:hypothetical protein, partial [Piscicoccus intestinalis]|uniref:hypothetical protein n=1 Tax=Piscicoccus intestinalis TaxID=746033 RepID=UPI001C3F3F12